MKTVCGVTPRFVNEIDFPDVRAASGGVGASTDSRLTLMPPFAVPLTHAREASACL